MRQLLLFLSLTLCLGGLFAQPVFISELVNDVVNNDGVGGEWFELSGTPGTDLSCYQITDGDDVIILPDGTTIPTDGYLLVGDGSTIDAGGASPDVDLNTCGCFSPTTTGNRISFTNSGEFLAVYDADQTLITGLIWEVTSNTSNNGPNGQTLTPLYPAGCTSMGNLSIVDLGDVDDPPAPWIFTSLNQLEGSSLVQDGKGGVSLSNSPTPGTAPPCSITNFAITEPVCTPGTANSTFTVSFCVVGGSGNYIALNPANNISYGTSGSNAPLNGMVSFLAGGNSGGTTPGVMAEVELINSIGSCSGGTLDILPPVCVANQAPVAVCQNVTIDANGNCMGTAVAADFDGGSTDADGDPLTFTLDNTGPFPLGATNVMLTVSDGTDSDMCMATITVADNTPPSVTCAEFLNSFEGCPAFLGANTPNGVWSTLPANGMLATAIGGTFITTIDLSTCVADNCSDLDEIEFTLGRSFEENRTGGSVDLINVIIFRDASLNESMDSVFVRVTIEDTEAPVIVCRDTTVALDATGMASLENGDVVTSIDDNCDDTPSGPNTMGGPGARTFDCTQAGTDVSVTVVSSDDAGNQGSCTYTVSVIDTLAPVLVCRDTTVALNAAGTAMLDNAQTVTSVVDNCDPNPTGPFTMGGPGARTFSCTQAGTDVEVTFVSSDVNGNEGSCTIAVSVIDTLAPVITCTTDSTVQLNAAGMVVFDPAGIVQTSSDNCTTALTVTASAPTTFDCGDVVETFPFTVTVADAAGNDTMCLVTVTVEDNIAPTFTVNSPTVTLNAAGTATLTIEDLLGNNVTDNCGIADTTVSRPLVFTCEDIGDSGVDVTITDVNGNETTLTATVFINFINPSPWAVTATSTSRSTRTARRSSSPRWYWPVTWSAWTRGCSTSWCRTAPPATAASSPVAASTPT